MPEICWEDMALRIAYAAFVLDNTSDTKQEDAAAKEMYRLMNECGFLSEDYSSVYSHLGVVKWDSHTFDPPGRIED